MKRQEQKHAQHGFTLLELMLSLTILAIVLTIIFSAFRMGIRVWDKGESALEKQQSLRLVIQGLRLQLRNFSNSQPATNQGQDAFFYGEKDYFCFVSYASMGADSSSRFIRVEYSVSDGPDGTRTLLIRESSALEPFDVEQRTTDGYYPVLSDLELIEFDYLFQKDQAPPEFTDFWGNDRGGWPQLIRLTMTDVDGASTKYNFGIPFPQVKNKGGL